MDNPEVINKKKKTKRAKPELIIVEEVSPKNKTLKSSSSSKTKTRCKKGTKKYKPLGTGCFTKEDIDNFKLIKHKSKTKKVIELEIEEPEEIIEIIPKKRIEL
jgi:hypothetical protein